MISNNARMGRALYLLKIELDNFIPREFLGHHEDQVGAVLEQILGEPRDEQKPFRNMKTQDLLAVMQASWWDVFDRALGGIEPALVREVALAHEGWANRQNFTPDATFQALTSIQRLLAAMSSPNTRELEMLKVESLESEVEAAESTVVEVVEPAAAPPPDAPVAEAVSEPSDAAVETAEPVEAEDVAEPTGLAEPYLADLVRALRETGALQEQDHLAQTTRDGIQPEYADASLLQELSPGLVSALAGAGIDRLYAHQAQALSQSLAGVNLLVEGSWAADETLTYAVPLAETLLRNPGGHALVLCSNQLLASQTVSRLENLLSPTGLSILAGVDAIPVGEVDDTDAESSEGEPSLILVTTPDVLNRDLLGSLPDRGEFLKNLKFVVIDQAREYRGYFGANVAVLLRRLAHALAALGADPGFFLAAAGCANGTELAENLTGKAFQAVSARNAPAPKRHYLFIDQREPHLPARADLADRVGRAAMACVASGRSVAIVCPTEAVAQQLYSSTLALGEERGVGQEAFSLNREGAPDSGSSGAAEAVFFAVTGAASFSGNFEGVILAGFPGSIAAAMGLLDCFGTSADGEGFLLYYPSNAPEDGFFAHNLDALLAREPDRIVVDADAPETIRPHLAHLVREASGRIYSFSRDVLGNVMFQALRRAGPQLASTDELAPEDIDLHSSGQQPWGLWCDGNRIGEMSAYRKFREAYPGAIVNLAGVKYRLAGVEEAAEDGSEPKILLESSEGLANLRTQPTFATNLTVQDETLCLSLASGVSLHLGSVAVEERLTQVSAADDSEMPQPGQEVQGRLEVSYAPEEESVWPATAQAFWIDVAALVAEAAETVANDGDGDSGAAPGVAALEQMLRLGARFTFPVDAYDLATYCQDASVFLVEVSPQAQGIVKAAFDHWRGLLEFGANLARRCPCDRGCPNCLVPASAPGRDLDKAAGLALAARLLEVTGES